jgi:hypothetical protein
MRRFDPKPWVKAQQTHPSARTTRRKTGSRVRKERAGAARLHCAAVTGKSAHAPLT